MTRHSKLLLMTSIFVACAVTTGAWFGPRVTAAASPSVIKVGLDIPYSGSDQFEGHHYYQAAQLFFGAVNRQGGINGHQFKFVLGDNQCDPAIGVTSARRLITQDHVNVLVGSACSSVTLAVMPLLRQYKVPEIDATATNPQISAQSGVGGNIWKFRLNLNDALMDRVFAKSLVAPVAKKVAIFAVNTDYGRAAVSIFSSALKNNGSSVSDVLYYTQGQPDFRSLLTKVKSESPSAVLLVSDYPDAAQIILQAHEVGLTTRFFGRGTVVTNELKGLVKNCSLINGIQEVNFWAPNKATAPLDRLYRARFHQPVPRDVVLAYYAMKLVYDAIKHENGKFDRNSIRLGLKSINEYLPGLGHIRFDNHNQAHYPMFITAFKNCQVTTVKTVATG